jgi:hypothetical protein
LDIAEGIIVQYTGLRSEVVKKMWNAEWESNTLIREGLCTLKETGGYEVK